MMKMSGVFNGHPRTDYLIEAQPNPAQPDRTSAPPSGVSYDNGIHKGSFFREVAMIPEYTDEEVMMFVEALNVILSANIPGIFSMTLQDMRSDFYSEGIVNEIISIPFDELPLYLVSSPEYNMYFKEWYEACISIRLKIGR